MRPLCIISAEVFCLTDILIRTQRAAITAQNPVNLPPTFLHLQFLVYIFEQLFFARFLFIRFFFTNSFFLLSCNEFISIYKGKHFARKSYSRWNCSSACSILNFVLPWMHFHGFSLFLKEFNCVQIPGTWANFPNTSSNSYSSGTSQWSSELQIFDQIQDILDAQKWTCLSHSHLS